MRVMRAVKQQAPFCSACGKNHAHHYKRNVLTGEKEYRKITKEDAFQEGLPLDCYICYKCHEKFTARKRGVSSMPQVTLLNLQKALKAQKDFNNRISLLRFMQDSEPVEVPLIRITTIHEIY